MSETVDVADDIKDAFSDLNEVSADALDPQTASDPVEEDDFAPEPEAVVAESGQPRGADGKFAPKDAGVVAPPEVAAPEASVAALPFQYRGAGQTHALDGATIHADGHLVVPAEQISALRQKLAAAAQFEAETYPRAQKLEQEVRELRTQRSVAETQANALLEKYQQALGMDEYEAVQAFLALRSEWPVMQAKAEADYWKNSRNAQPNGAAPVQQQGSTSGAPSRETAVAEVVDTFEAMRLELAARPEYRASVSDADWKQLSEQLTRIAPAFVRPVTADEARRYGMQQGEYALDTDALSAEVTDRLAAFAAKGKAALAAKAAQTAGRFNTGATGAKAPTTPAKRSAQPAMAAAPTEKSARDEAREKEQYRKQFKKKFMSSANLLQDEDEDE